jgi:hypothetical protein
MIRIFLGNVTHPTMCFCFCFGVSNKTIMVFGMKCFKICTCILKQLLNKKYFNSCLERFHLLYILCNQYFTAANALSLLSTQTIVGVVHSPSVQNLWYHPFVFFFTDSEGERTSNRTIGLGLEFTVDDFIVVPILVGSSHFFIYLRDVPVDGVFYW